MAAHSGRVGPYPTHTVHSALVARLRSGQSCLPMYNARRHQAPPHSIKIYRAYRGGNKISNVTCNYDPRGLAHPCFPGNAGCFAAGRRLPGLPRQPAGQVTWRTVARAVEGRGTVADSDGNKAGSLAAPTCPDSVGCRLVPMHAYTLLAGAR